MTERKLISKRVQYASIESVVDEYCHQFVAHFKLDNKQSEEMKGGLTTLLKRFVYEVDHATKLGAEKGITEALALMSDPDFHATIKKRKAKQRARATKDNERYAGKRLLGELLK